MRKGSDSILCPTVAILPVIQKEKPCEINPQGFVCYPEFVACLFIFKIPQ